jgi:hypothetical protein
MPAPPRTCSRCGVRIRAGAILAAICLLVWGQGTAGAVGSVTITVNPVPVASGSFVPVDVRWSGQPAGKVIFLTICNEPSSTPEFRPGINCSSLSEVTPNGTPNGAGVAQVPIFRGPEPSGDLRWGCFAPEDTAPPGVLKLTTCYLRLTNDVLSNNLDAVEVPFTVTGKGAPPPGGTLGAPVPAATVEAATTTVPAGPAPIAFTG